MNRPWMPLYVGDYIADTAHLSAAQHGAYLLLMMHYWQKGGLPTDDGALARVAKMTPAEWRKSRSTIQEFFQDGWKHKRIEFELTEAARISAAGRAGGLASGLARQRNRNDPPTKSERSLNDTGNDSSTKCEALPSQTHTQKEDEERKNARKRASSAAFELFWEKFPNKVGKAGTQRVFEKIEKSGCVSIEKLMAGLEKYVRKTDDRPWCNPITWLNQGRWDDQPAASKPNGVHHGKRSLSDAADRRIAQSEEQDRTLDLEPADYYETSSEFGQGHCR